jgi:hypothetical protein
MLTLAVIVIACLIVGRAVGRRGQRQTTSTGLTLTQRALRPRVMRHGPRDVVPDWMLTAYLPFPLNLAGGFLHKRFGLGAHPMHPALWLIAPYIWAAQLVFWTLVITAWLTIRTAQTVWNRAALPVIAHNVQERRLTKIRKAGGMGAELVTGLPASDVRRHALEAGQRRAHAPLELPAAAATPAATEQQLTAFVDVPLYVAADGTIVRVDAVGDDQVTTPIMWAGGQA